MKLIHRIQLLMAAICLVALLLFPGAMGSLGWNRTYQGEAMDALSPTSVVQTGDGGYAIAISGFLRRVDNVGYQGHFTTSFDLELLKTNSDGETQWKRSFDKIEDPNHQTATIYPYSDRFLIVQTADQGFVIAANSQSEFWLVKFDSQGNVLWTKTYVQNIDYPSNCRLNSIIQTADLGFALAGSAATNEGSNDFWLLKVNSQGNIQWSQTYNSGTYTNINGDKYPCEDEATSVIQTRDGAYVLVGSASLYRASTTSLVYSTWIVKTDNQGKQLWNKGLNLINVNDYGRFIIETYDGGFAVAGSENNNFCLLKIDSNRQLQWSKIYNDIETQIVCGLVQLNDGGYAMAGTAGNGASVTYTMVLLRLDSSGQTTWTRNYHANQNSITISNDWAYGFIRTADGGYALIGSTEFSSETHKDVFLVKTESLEEPPQTTTKTTTTTLNPSNSEPIDSLTPPPTDLTPTPSTNSVTSNTSPTQIPNEILMPDLGKPENQILLIALAIAVTVVLATVFLVRIRRRPKR